MISDTATENLFDTREPFDVAIRSGGRRECKIRYPSDKQWMERAAKICVKQTDIGRDKSVSELVPIEKWDGQLFETLLISTVNGAEFDDYERSTVIDRLSLANVVASSQEPDDQLSVTLEVFGRIDGEQRLVKLFLREPRRKDVVEYGRSLATKVVHHRKGQDIRMSLEPSMHLFEKCFVRAEGYADGSPVPAVHQDAAILEMNRLLGEV